MWRLVVVVEVEVVGGKKTKAKDTQNEDRLKEQLGGRDSGV